MSLPGDPHLPPGVTSRDIDPPHEPTEDTCEGEDDPALLRAEYSDYMEQLRSDSLGDYHG